MVRRSSLKPGITATHRIRMILFTKERKKTEPVFPPYEYFCNIRKNYTKTKIPVRFGFCGKVRRVSLRSSLSVWLRRAALLWILLLHSHTFRVERTNRGYLMPVTSNEKTERGESYDVYRDSFLSWLCWCFGFLNLLPWF